MLKDAFFKIILLLIAISLLMALSSCRTKIKIAVFLVEPALVCAGSGRNVLVERERLIRGSARAELYLKAVNCLRPGRRPFADDLTTAFRKEFKINNITENEGTAIVDFSSRNLSGDELTEKLLISQIVSTLLKSFDEIQAVAFTVDGEPADTLMGCADISGNFTSPII